MMKKLLLIGSAEANRAIIHSIAEELTDRISAVLVTTLPNKTKEKNSPLTPGQAENIRVVVDELAALDLDSDTAIFRSGHKVTYDYISLNTGRETDLSCLSVLGDRLLPVNPIDRFYNGWRELLAYSVFSPLFQLVIVADDLSSLPLAACVCEALEQKGANFTLALVLTNNNDMPIGTTSSEHVERFCKSGQFQIHCAQAAGTNTGVLLSNGTELYADRVIVASKTRPPPWLEITPLSTDRNGLVVVDDKHRSVSHQNVFASGDMALEPVQYSVDRPSSNRHGDRILKAIG
jgi:NADH dehydrogenase FAD-containing subunit